jgi:hypothetical protein
LLRRLPSSVGSTSFPRSASIGKAQDNWAINTDGQVHRVAARRLFLAAGYLQRYAASGWFRFRVARRCRVAGTEGRRWFGFGGCPKRCHQAARPSSAQNRSPSNGTADQRPSHKVVCNRTAHGRAGWLIWRCFLPEPKLPLGTACQYPLGSSSGEAHA